METLLVILHRWRLSVPAVLLALATGGTAFFVVPPGYEDSTQVLFIGSPNQPGEKVASNPYLALSSTLVSTADVIRLTVTTAQTEQSLADQGATAFYDVALDQSTPAPVLLVTTKDSDPTVARRTAVAVVAEIARLLEEVQQQAGAPRSTWVGSTVISRLPEPVRKLNQSLRPAIGATVGVLALTFFGLFLLEGRRRTGTTRRSRPSAAPAEPQPYPPAFATQPQPQPAPAQAFSTPLPPAPPAPPVPPQSPADVAADLRWNTGLSPRRPNRPRSVTLPSDSEGRATWTP